jgi:DNA gyrase/topoisomerase IV subunit A
LENLNPRASGVLGIELVDKNDRLIQINGTNGKDYLVVIAKDGDLSLFDSSSIAESSLAHPGQMISKTPIGAAIVVSKKTAKLDVVTSRQQVVDVNLKDYKVGEEPKKAVDKGKLGLVEKVFEEND